MPLRPYGGSYGSVYGSVYGSRLLKGFLSTWMEGALPRGRLEGLRRSLLGRSSTVLQDAPHLFQGTYGPVYGPYTDPYLEAS